MNKTEFARHLFQDLNSKAFIYPDSVCHVGPSEWF